MVGVFRYLASIVLVDRAEIVVSWGLHAVFVCSKVGCKAMCYQTDCGG